MAENPTSLSLQACAEATVQIRMAYQALDSLLLRPFPDLAALVAHTEALIDAAQRLRQGLRVLLR